MISELREKIVTDLTEVCPVYDTFLADFQPPGVMVTTPRNGTYIVKGQIPGDFEISLDVIVVVPRGETPPAELSTLDDLVELVLINTVDWAFRGVDTPSLINISGAEFPATVIHLAKQDRLYDIGA